MSQWTAATEEAVPHAARHVPRWVLRGNFREEVGERPARRPDWSGAGVRTELAVGMLPGLGARYGTARGRALHGEDLDTP